MGKSEICVVDGKIEVGVRATAFVKSANGALVVGMD